ncbi:MAG TPA: CPXCG motif-containing cysteine-rich protein [Thermoanaerobaculia bacterium]|nr:CPXCG motif-containing cysteine-rich protein [Thermoanaerobaculia bacterium]
MIPAIPARCPVCGEISEIAVDPSGGAIQDYTEDCAVCCRPLRVRVTFDAWGDAEVSLTPENA